MNRFTAIVLTLLTASGTALSQRGMDMRGADIKDAGDVQSASLTLGGGTITGTASRIWGTDATGAAIEYSEGDNISFAGGQISADGLVETNHTGNVKITGTVDATAFVGDGSGLTGLPDITAASITPVPVTNDWLYLSEGSYRSLDSSGATTNSLSIEPGLATSIDFIRLDVKWDGVSTIEWPSTNLVTYIDTLDISSNTTSVVVFDSAMWETNWTGHLFPKESE